MICPDCGRPQRFASFCPGCGDSLLAVGFGIIAVPALVLAIGWLPASVRDLRNHPAAPSGDSVGAGTTHAISIADGLPQGAGGHSYGAGRKHGTADSHHPARPSPHKER